MHFTPHSCQVRGSAIGNIPPIRKPFPILGICDTAFKWALTFFHENSSELVIWKLIFLYIIIKIKLMLEISLCLLRYHREYNDTWKSRMQFSHCLTQVAIGDRNNSLIWFLTYWKDNLLVNSIKLMEPAERCCFHHMLNTLVHLPCLLQHTRKESFWATATNTFYDECLNISLLTYVSSIVLHWQIKVFKVWHLGS